MQTILLALICGAAIGFCLGALGGGGGILVWPALVFGIGLAAQDASLLGKGIVGASAMFAAAMHWRRGTVDLPRGLSMAAIGMLGAVFGSRFIALTGMDAATTKQAMTVLLAVLMLVVSALMLQKGLRNRRREVDDSKQPEETSASQSRMLRWTVFVLAGFGIGFLTGFLGVGGGFMIVPTLVFVFAMPMRIAAGTSLVVISLTCGAGIVASFDAGARWDLAALFTVGSLVFSAVAVRVAGKARQSTLQIAFSGLVVVLGILMFWKLSL